MPMPVPPPTYSQTQTQNLRGFENSSLNYNSCIEALEMLQAMPYQQSRTTFDGLKKGECKMCLFESESIFEIGNY